MRDNSVVESLLGVSAGILELNDEIRLVAPLNVPVLVSGERGTGKKLVAALLQRYCEASGGSIVTIDCTSSQVEFEEVSSSASPDEAPRAAQTMRRAIVLQHVDRLSMASQALLYRYLEIRDKPSEAASKSRGATLRVISTTETDLFALVTAGGFRDDLYYRLNTIHLVIPPLRERREDIPVHVRHWLSVFSKDHQVACPQLSSATLEQLLTSDWPGNVGELRRVVDGLCHVRGS
jgi:DNA-binding NtrC family response regulator